MRGRSPGGRGIAGAMVVGLVFLAGCTDSPDRSSPAATGTPAPTSAAHDDRNSPSATQSSSGQSSASKGTSAATGGSGRGSISATAKKPASSSASSSAGDASDSCADLAGQLTLNRQIGQLFMSGIDSTGIGSGEAATLSRLDVGSVVLLGDSTSGVHATKKVSDKIKKSLGAKSKITAMVATDQEGGKVQRLRGSGFDRIPNGPAQAKLSDSELTRHATTWGKQLRRAGVDADLAPVADVVPTSIGRSNQPIGALKRGYGASPSTVASKDVAFIKGMRAAHEASGVKHFPGLGKVRGNTDVSADVVDHQTTTGGNDLKGFRDGVRAGTDMVMMSSARYAKIDKGNPAAFSSKIISGMVRDALNFDGVVASDDLQGKALEETPNKQRALQFFRAGGDLAVVGDAARIPAMVKKVRTAARQHDDLRSAIRKSATRVLSMKAKYGLVDCD